MLQGSGFQHERNGGTPPIFKKFMQPHQLVWFVKTIQNLKLSSELIGVPTTITQKP